MSDTKPKQQPKYNTAEIRARKTTVKKAVNLLTISEFAAKKGVSAVNVYTHLGNEKIIPVCIGAGEHIYIDWEQYKDHHFQLQQRGKYVRKPKPKPVAPVPQVPDLD